MAKLIYDAFTSLDGYVADENGNFDWAELSEEVYAFINNRERQIGTYLFGRKLYETMAVWETPEVIPRLPAAALEFVPIWQAAERSCTRGRCRRTLRPIRGSSGNSTRRLYWSSRQK